MSNNCLIILWKAQMAANMDIPRIDRHFEFGGHCILFVCIGFFVPLENVWLIWRRDHYHWRATNFDLCSALIAIEQRGFFSVPHLLWNGASVYNDHLWGPVTLTPTAERLAAELSLAVFTTYVCPGWDSNAQPSACGANALTHCATAAASTYVRSSDIHFFLPNKIFVDNFIGILQEIVLCRGLRCVL